MPPVKLFLAASRGEELPAEAFASQLKQAAKRADLDVDVRPWYRDDAFPPGKDYLSALIDHCKGRDGVKPSDFFAVILSDNEEHATACLFELGLFVGGLGLEPRRCFMLSARGDESLPAALRGRAKISFKPPSDGNDPDAWSNAMKEPANAVRTSIRMLRAFVDAEFQSMSAEMLMDLEAAPIGYNGTGQLAAEAEVLVNRAQPIEENQQPFAACVLYNMKHGVKYRYFFHDKEGFPSIARLIYALSTVVPDPDNPRRPAPGETAPQSVIADNLKVLQQQLSINLIPSPGPIEFCVHNITDLQRAKCYLRYPFSERFVQWCERQDAVYVARELTDMGMNEDDLSHLFVLRSTRYFDLNAPENQETKKRLWNAIRKCFADEKLNPVLREVCFEYLTDEETQRWKQNQNPWDDVGRFRVQTA